MSDPTNPLDWVVKAEEDYTLARSSLRRKAPLLYGAGFHAQQCAEKYLTPPIPKGICCLLTVCGRVLYCLRDDDLEQRTHRKKGRPMNLEINTLNEVVVQRKDEIG